MIRLTPRKWLNQVLRNCGYELAKLSQRDLMYDIARFLPRRDDLMIFDVGAHMGQTARKFRAAFPRATIHCFDPGEFVFAGLKKNVAGDEKIFPWNLGVGAEPGRMKFFENQDSVMSSFLPLGELGWGTIEKEDAVELTTIDKFCAEQKIDSIDVLKSDTQGYDFAVFKGAEEMMKRQKIGIIYYEVNFSELYRGMPPFEETLRFLNGYGFRLETFYKVERTNRNRAVWTDAFFVHERLVPKPRARK